MSYHRNRTLTFVPSPYSYYPTSAYGDAAVPPDVAPVDGEGLPAPEEPKKTGFTDYLQYLPVVGGFMQQTLGLQDYRLELAEVRAKIENKMSSPFAPLLQGDINKLRAREAELVEMAAESEYATRTTEIVRTATAVGSVLLVGLGGWYAWSVIKNRRLTAQIQQAELKRLRGL